MFRREDIISSLDPLDYIPLMLCGNKIYLLKITKRICCMKLLDKRENVFWRKRSVQNYLWKHCQKSIHGVIKKYRFLVLLFAYQF